MDLFILVEDAEEAVNHIDQFYSKYLLSPKFLVTSGLFSSYMSVKQKLNSIVILLIY